MSLVVLSSQQNFNDGATTQDIEKSSRFQNHFTKAVEIPVNSEVAVISAKLNRSQKFNIPRKNQLRVYLGEELSDTKSLDDTTSMPIMVRMFNYDDDNDLTVNQLRDRLQTKLNEYTLHPEFIGRTVVSASYGTGGIFEGFNIQVSASKNGSTNSSKVSEEWASFCDTSDDFIISSCGTYGQVITSSADGLGECCCVGTDSPIATSGGEFHFTLKNGSANNFAWSVGLTRPLNVQGNPKGRSTTTPRRVYPRWYNPIPNPIGFIGYGDIKIVKEVGESVIRVFQTLYDSSKSHRIKSVEDVEIEYWNGSNVNSCFTAESGPVNSASFSSYKITVENERVSIYGLTAGSVGGGVTGITLIAPGQEYTPGSYTNIATTTDGSGSGATLNLEINGLGSITSATINQAGSGYAADDKLIPDATIGEGIELAISVASVTSGSSGSFELITGAFSNDTQISSQLTKPLNQNEWALYPVVEINGATDDFVHITRWNGAYKPDGTKINFFTETYYNKMYNTMLNIGRTNRWYKQLKDLETRFNRYSDISTQYTYQLERGTAPNNSVNKSVVYVLGQTTRYLPSSLFSPIYDWRDMLGFQTVVVDESTFSTNSDSNSVRSFTSTTQPLTSSTKQAFIKLDNLNIESFNGATSDISKILYTLPRFDNTGNAVGSLYFESPDRYYLRLNNTAPLLLNRLDCSIVGIDNKIIQTLYGNTVVMLHFRSAK